MSTHLLIDFSTALAIAIAIEYYDFVDNSFIIDYLVIVSGSAAEIFHFIIGFIDHIIELGSIEGMGSFELET